LLQAKLTDVLKELRQNTVTLTQGIESRTEFLAQELDWLSVFQAKSLQLVHKGKKLSNSVPQLLNGVRELNYGRLSQDIVPYATLKDAIEHVRQKIATGGNVSMYVIPNDVGKLHKQAIVHHVQVQDHLIISLLILLTTNRKEFMCYKIIKHNVTVPNSDIYTRLESEAEYIANEWETMQYAYITKIKAYSLQMDKDYLLPKKIIYNEDVNDCITAIYLNNHTSIKDNCKYNVYQEDKRMQVIQYDDNKFYLRNTVNYTIQCYVGNIYKGYAKNYIKKYTCHQDCLIDVDNIHPEINITAGNWTTHCVLKTNAWTLHFKPTDSIKTSQGPRYLKNLPVLSRQYSDDQIRHLDYYTELKTTAHIDMPKIKIKFHKGDPLFNIKLNAILNQTENDKELFASVYRDPDFMNRIRDRNDYDVTSLLGMILATVSLMGIISLLIKQRKLTMAMMALQTQITTVAKALDVLQLTQRPKPT